MKNEFIPYSEALELKELGFDEECLGWHNSKRLLIDNYNNYNSKMPFEYCCSVPLYQQAFRWFREKYNLHSHIEYSKGFYEYWILLDAVGYDTYEEAELACLKKLIEITKSK